jgi:hypothetical protein
VNGIERSIIHDRKKKDMDEVRSKMGGGGGSDWCIINRGKVHCGSSGRGHVLSTRGKGRGVGVETKI